MIKGDKVIIHDGSYAMSKENGVLSNISGNALKSDGYYEVLKVAKAYNRFPTDNSTAKMLKIKKEINNLQVKCVKNPDRIVYTQARFCSKV